MLRKSQPAAAGTREISMAPSTSREHIPMAPRPQRPTTGVERWPKWQPILHLAHEPTSSMIASRTPASEGEQEFLICRADRTELTKHRRRNYTGASPFPSLACSREVGGAIVFPAFLPPLVGSYAAWARLLQLRPLMPSISVPALGTVLVLRSHHCSWRSTTESLDPMCRRAHDIMPIVSSVGRRASRSITLAAEEPKGDKPALWSHEVASRPIA